MTNLVTPCPEWSRVCVKTLGGQENHVFEISFAQEIASNLRLTRCTAEGKLPENRATAAHRCARPLGRMRAREMPAHPSKPDFNRRRRQLDLRMATSTGMRHHTSLLKEAPHGKNAVPDRFRVRDGRARSRLQGMTRSQVDSQPRRPRTEHPARPSDGRNGRYHRGNRGQFQKDSVNAAYRLAGQRPRRSE